ncbi:hypothetical protein BGZ49_005989 [Haplosporangium sp. Z 27]|nr:hypothetical protein BGZ49_005989 [Haplosporangium sp. Z 27]
MKSLISDVFDHNDHKQQYDRSQQRSTTRKELSGPLVTSSRGRTSLQYRNNTAPSSFWSDDEEPKDQDEDGAYDSDEKEHDVRRHNEARNFNHNRQRMSRRNIKDQRTNSLRREVSQSHLQDQYPSKGRVWSENVDLPFILSGYVQVAMNTVFVGILIYIIANFIATIQSDVSMRMEGILNREIKKIERCRIDYYETYSCHKKHGPALFTVCENLLSCKEQPLPRIARATVAAETFAHIFNSFVNTMSYKTMGFVMVIVFGGLYFSNQAISSYRSNHVMHHQHTVVSPSNIPSRLNSTRSFSSISNGSQSRSDNSATNPYGFPTSSTSHDNSFAIDQPSRSGQLVQRRFGVQRHDSLRDVQQDSDEDFDMDI